MNPRINELVAELPEDLRGPATNEAELAEMLSVLSRKPVPAGRVFRMWSLGSLQARVAAGYMAYWLRSRFAGREEKERLRDEAHLAAALRLLSSMGYLRGALMKLGQTLASYPRLVPDEFVETLQRLHFEAPPMHYSLLREHVFHELGGDPEELFAEFETEAFAAASLGQVHRARLRSGERVAVKIQYPNIARTIRADFANLRALLQPMRFLADWDAYMATAAEIERVFLLEADYANELRNAEKVRAVLAGMDDVVVPRMHPELSSERVLTMEYLDGMHPGPKLLTEATQERRDMHGVQILRIASRLLHSGRMFHADPNPGNFLCLPDGRLGLLDFGCVRECDEEEWDLMVIGYEGYREGGEALREAIQRGALMTDEEMADEERYALCVRACEWLWEAMRDDEPFDFGDEDYIQRGVENMVAMMRAGYTKTHPIFTWVNRMLYGLRMLMYQMRASVNLTRLDREEAARAGL